MLISLFILDFNSLYILPSRINNLYDKDLNELFYELQPSDIAYGLYIDLKLCNTKDGFKKFGAIIDQQFKDIPYFDIKGTNAYNFDFQYERKTNPRSLELKNAIFLYFIALILVYIIFYLSRKINR